MQYLSEGVGALDFWTVCFNRPCQREETLDSLQKRNSFFKNAKAKRVTTEVGEPSSVSNVNPHGQQTMEECIGGSDSTKSEIVWILNSVVHGEQDNR